VFDAQGRVLIPARLREAAGMAGDVDVLGQLHYSKSGTTIASYRNSSANRFADDDARALADAGI